MPMQQVPPEIAQVASKVKNGQRKRAKVRTLLRWFGYASRGRHVRQEIVDALCSIGLRTEPDFTSVPLDVQVYFVPADCELDTIAESDRGETDTVDDDSVDETDSADETTAAKTTTATDEFSLRVAADPVYRVSRLDAANREPMQIAPDAPIGDAVHLMLEYPDVKFTSNKDEQGMANVVDRVDACLKRKGHGKLEEWRPIQQVIADINAGQENVPAALIEAASAVLSPLNAVFDPDTRS